MASDLSIQEELFAQNLKISIKTYVELKELFNLVDLDHGGSIQANELRELMKTLGMKDAESKLLVDKMMLDYGKEDIDFESFCTSMIKKVDPLQDRSLIQDSFFYLFGKQTVAVSHIAKTLNQFIPDPNFEQVINSVFPGDKINIKQFLDTCFSD